jgi:hypothetical protein
MESTPENSLLDVNDVCCEYVTLISLGNNTNPDC